MKIIARILVFVLIVLQFNGIIENVSYAYENNKIEVSNGFVKYSVNKDNGRFSISTESGAAYRNDENQPLLFEEYVPDTSFTTFKINGEDYIYGNDYGFLGIGSHFNKIPNNTGLENESTWVVNGVEITQTLILDNTEQNAGNVKVSYHVRNTTNNNITIGSRILLDTMLGANDGSPVIFPGNQTFIEKEKEFSGSEIPVYWKSVDNKDFANIVSYGLISGWRNDNILNQDELYNTKPNKMIIGHWEGLSKTKWDYDIDGRLNFTSPNNVYGSRDSAVALYWDEHTLGAGKERVYETYYGLGEYSTAESEIPVGLSTYAPERLYLNDTKTGYTTKTVTVSGEIDNTLSGSQQLINAKATIECSTAGLALPYGESKTIDLGTIEANTITPFSWDLNTSPLYSWTNFQYRVTLTADNLTQPITRDGSVLIPSITGEPPEIKFTDYFPGNLYFLDDEKVLTITGQNLDAITYGNNYRLIITSEKTGKKYVIGKENLEFSNTSITVNIPNSLLFMKVGLYNVTIEYLEDGENKSYTFDAKLNLSDDKKYMIRKYGILMVVRVMENGDYTYKLVNAKDESELEALGKNESIILDLRADEIIKIGDIYTINSETVTINSVVTCLYNQQYGDDPMIIEKKSNDISHNDDYIFITGKGKLEIPGFQFHNGPYEMEFEDGQFYSVTDEDDAEDVVIHKPLLYKGLPVIDYNIILQALPISINEAVLRENAITFGGSIDLASLLNGAQKLSEKKKDDNNNDNNEEDEGNDVDLGCGLNIEDLRFGVNNGYVTLEGLKADGSVGIPKKITKKIVPECDLGAEIGVAIDTFDNWMFEIKADINFEVIQAKGDIVFKIFEIEGFPIPIPDKVIIYGGNKQPGIPLIPPVPVGFLTGLGGGFEGLYDTLTLNFNFLPPLTLNAIASFQLFKILEANEAQLKVSARGISFNVAEIGIGPLEIFKDVGMHVFVKDDLKYPGFEIKTYAGLDIAGWVTGEAYYLCAVDAAKHGNLGPVTIIGEASGSVQVPDDSPIFPGMEFADANFGISDEGIFARLTAFGFVPAAFSYYWGGNVVLGIASLDEQYMETRGIYSAPNYDEKGEIIGTVCIGENFHVVSDSCSEYRFASILNDLPIRLAGLDKIHDLDIINHDYSLIEVEYYGDEPELHLYTPEPNRQEISLTKDTNYFIQKAAAVSDANKIYIPLEKPDNSTWQLTSSKSVNTRLIKIDEIPELTQVSGSLNGSQLTVNWSGKKLNDEKVNIVLFTDDDNVGKIVASDIAVTSGNADIQLPNDLPSGNYYIRAQLISQEGAVLSTIDSENTIEYNDPNQPKILNNMTVSNCGNGLLNVRWNDSETVDGYVIDVIDEETNEIVSSFDLTENAGDNIIGGTYNQISSLTDSRSVEDVSEGGMIPGRTYTIAVSSYNVVNDTKHYSEQVTEVVTVNQPNPADIDYTISSEQGKIVDKGMIDNIQTFLTKEQNVNLSLRSDQEVEWKVTVNDEVVYNQTSKNAEVSIDLTSQDNNIGIKAVNEQGDISEKGFNIELDKEPPVLRIDSPEQGQLIKDNIVISGFVDLNSTLFINGEEADYDNNGLFNAEIPMGSDMVKTILVEAVDEANNKSEYLAEVYNDKVKDIKDIKIQPSTNQLVIGEKVDYNVCLIDKDNNEFIVDDSVIKWSLLNDYNVIDVNQQGEVCALTKGKDVLIASYQISEDYAFEDAVIIEAVEEFRETDSISVSPDDIYIYSNNYETLKVYEIFNDTSNRLLDNEMLDFDIISGNDFIDISDKGKIFAKKAGEAIVSVRYVKNGKEYTADALIHVTNNSSNNHNHLTPDDKFILNVIKGLVNKDGSLKITLKESDMKKENGKAAAAISSKGIEQAFEKVNKNNEGKKKIILDIPRIECVNGYIIYIPTTALKSDNENIIELQTHLGSIMLSCDMLQKSQVKGTDYISLVIEEADSGHLGSQIKEEIGDRPIIEISVMSNGQNINWKNQNSPVKVFVSYTPKDEEDYEKLVVLYIDKNGKAAKVTNGKYDSEKGMVVFDTTHLSTYAVAYNDKTFSDLSAYPWAEHQIEVLASKGIINGTSNTTYSPQQKITRADFLTLLVRTLELTAEIDSNFNDIKPTDYYYEAVGIAKKLKITTGSGNNMFNPKESITRQDMMVMTERALRIKGMLAEDYSITELDKFKDKDTITSYAQNSIAVLVKEGLIKGSDNTINPKGNTTRAEIAVLLYRIYNK